VVVVDGGSPSSSAEPITIEPSSDTASSPDAWMSPRSSIHHVTTMISTLTTATGTNGRRRGTGGKCTAA
jgi:hypothetical protein